MSQARTARSLRGQIASLETMTRFVLATLALASGVYTYLGVRSLLDGEATMVFFAAVIYSAAVSVGIYGFWTYLIRFVPDVRDMASRLGLVAVMALGSAMIIAMSSWLNAAALAGSAAVEQHLATTIEGYTADLDQANSNAIAAQSLLPDIQRASERFARLAEEERESGALTGSSGSGSVVQLLSQMSAQMRELEASIVASRETVSLLFDEGQGHLATMRGLVSGSGAVAPRADKFGEEAVALTAVISALEQTSIAPSVSRAAADLSAGFIAPVADGRSADLAGRQDAVMARVRASVAAQSEALSAAAGEILALPRVAERRFVPLSAAEAVLLYASSFLPSWAGAISIDLMPAVLVGIMAIVYGAIRRDEDELTEADLITAGDMLRALDVHAAIAARRKEESDATSPEPAPDSREAKPDAPNVTPLSLTDRKRTDP
ncbi:MAG: hypothetical protein JJ969_11235 [Rhizobiaceae bacterium]|nr:hypothetical protein [Rhizobiaceae bacterium]